MDQLSRPLRVATWNLERRKPTTPLGVAALDVAFGTDADIVVLTESSTDTDPRGGHLLPAPHPPPGTRFRPDERKVVAWSKTPWREVDAIELDDIDRSRFVTGITDTPIGPVRVVGVCIPWRMAGVTSDERTAAPWQRHHEFLESLTAILGRCPEPTVVAGDFNQRVPRVKGGNRAVAEALDATFAELSIVTSGTVEGCERPGIDHIGCSGELRPERVWGWPNDVGGRRLSDHDGAAVDLVLG